MIKNIRRSLLLVCLCASSLASAQSFPNKPVHVLIGFGAGGVTDILARLFAADWSNRLGQPVVVENRPGASGLLAAQAVKSAAPDGYTLHYGVVTTFSPIYIKSNAIVASKELAPVATAAFGDYFIYVAANLPINSLKDLLAWSKANPGKLRFGTATTSNHMLLAMIAKRMGIVYENIPYKTSDQTITALLAGDAQVTLNAATGFLQHLESGKLRAIATLGTQRSEYLKDVQTVTEQGVPVAARFNHGVWTTLGTPQPVIARLNSVVNESLKDPALSAKLRGALLSTTAMTPEEVRQTFEREMQFYTEAAALIGFKPE